MRDVICVEDVVCGIMNEFLSKFNLECEPAEEFVYYKECGVCGFNLDEADRGMDKIWEVIKSINPNILVSNLLFSFLHELGHHVTMQTYTREFIADQHRKIYKIEKRGRRMGKYYWMPLEYDATKWAVDYVTANQEEIKEIDKKLKMVLDTFQ